MKFEHKVRDKAMFEKISQISQLINWPIKEIIVNISKTIKDIIKIQTAYKTCAQGACIRLYEIFF